MKFLLRPYIANDVFFIRPHSLLASDARSLFVTFCFHITHTVMWKRTLSLLRFLVAIEYLTHQLIFNLLAEFRHSIQIRMMWSILFGKARRRLSTAGVYSCSVLVLSVIYWVFISLHVVNFYKIRALFTCWRWQWAAASCSPVTSRYVCYSMVIVSICSPRQSRLAEFWHTFLTLRGNKTRS